jgi:Tfp pilus assembly protein PilN
VSQQINLINVNPHKREGAFSVRNMLQALGGILLCIILVYVYVAYRSSEMAGQIAEVKNKQLAEQQRLAGLTAEYIKQRAGLTLDQELNKVTAEATAQREIINALKSGVIGNTMGYSKYMQAFARQVVNGLWLTGFSVEADGLQMSISGGVLSPDLVPGYILRLNNENIMRGKTFTSLQMQLPKEESGKTSNRQQYLEFELKSVVKSEADKR